VLDRPYCVVMALCGAIRVRKYREIRLNHSVAALAQPLGEGGTTAIDNFFESICPKDMLVSSMYSFNVNSSSAPTGLARI
jgi:hypothetical protein